MTHACRAGLGLILCVVWFHGTLLRNCRAQSLDVDRVQHRAAECTSPCSLRSPIEKVPRLGPSCHCSCNERSRRKGSLFIRNYEVFSTSDGVTGPQTSNWPNASASLSEEAADPGFSAAEWEYQAALDGQRNEMQPALIEGILNDHLHFYAPDSLFVVGSGLAVGGLLANTSLDSDIQRHLQSSLRSANTDDWLEALHANKELGNGIYTLPVFAGAWIVGNALEETRAGQISGRWGERSLRGFLVGAPPLLALQFTTGASRPGETVHSSEWKPFQDNNGISGHAFMGSLPFITAAKMTDSAGLKAIFYSASTLAPLSRAGENAHYPSQVALGWWMAYIAASAVDATDDPGSHWRLIPTTVGNGSGLAVEYSF